jgi:hypothetical protein
MPVNRGRKPPHEMVDIKLRQGAIIRNTPSEQWRWKPWPEGPSAGDIVQWQAAGALTRWEARQSSKA